MHFLTRVIVEAQSSVEALEAAETVMDQLVEWREFDWFANEASRRWDNCWQPVRLNSDLGLAQVRNAVSGQYDDFVRTLGTIRFMMANYSDEQIFNEEFEQISGHFLSRYQFSVASGYHANACYLFGHEGMSIINSRELERYTADAGKYWVVQVDCHN